MHPDQIISVPTKRETKLLYQELLDFTEFLLSREHIKKSKLKSDPKKDPIFGIIGLANEKPYASDINDELYGNR